MCKYNARFNVSCENLTPYTGAVGILLSRCGTIIMGKLK
jgi:hypothetical protein